MKSLVIATLALAFQLAPQQQVKPARYRSGSLPAQPPQVTSGGQVLLEVKVDKEGRVIQAVTLRTTPPFTDLMRDAVRSWRFDPAEEDYKEVESSVLVAGLFLPPTFYGGPTVGEPPKDVESASDAVCVPYTIVPPVYPAGALYAGVALAEVVVGRDGRVEHVQMVRSAPGFDDAIRAAVLKWKFRPARRRGTPVPSFAYIAFGFRPPVTPPPSKLN